MPDLQVLDEIQEAFGTLRPGRVRSMRDFAEEEVILPEGPYEDLPYRADRVPATAVALEEMDSDWWRRYFGMGDVQDGKTLTFVVLPALYHLFEIGEDIGFAGPTKDMACEAFQEKVKPVIERSFPHMWPESGPGSQGGQVEKLQFENGSTVRFFGAAGGDEQRSSHTVRIMIVTELDKMDRSRAASRETDPVSQLEERTSSFDERARFYGECTTSVKEGRINQEVHVTGSGTQVYLDCPYCDTPVLPVREQFSGWEDAENELDAEESARWECPHCGNEWTEEDRLDALHDITVVHKTQEIDPETGDIVGDRPRTRTFGLHWWFMHSPIKSMGHIAQLEWKATQTQTEDAEKRVAQFHWSQPYEAEREAQELSMSLLAEHTADWRFDPFGVLPGTDRRDERQVPEAVEWWIGSVDVQKRWLYYLIDGFSEDLTRWTLTWGVTEIIPDGAQYEPTENHVRLALDATRDLCMDHGCDTIWVDTGYRHECANHHVIRNWCQTAGDAVQALVGRGAEQMRGKRAKNLPESIPGQIQARLQDDGTWLWFIDVDWIKDEVFFRLFRERGSAGYHYFAREAANSGRTGRSRGQGSVGWIFSHFMRVERNVTTRGTKTKREWVEHGRHDLWDCAGYGLAGAMITKAYDQETGERESGARSPEREAAPQTSIRTQY